MKKRVVSLLLAAALMIGALAGCGSDSKDGESESVTESARNESVTSVPSKEQDSGRPDDSTSSAPSDASGKGRDRRDTRSHESRVDSNESRGKDVTETPEAPEDAADIARAALDGQIKLKNTVEYSYMNNITCSVEGTEVLIETANKVKAYGTEDVQGNILTVSKESELSRDGQILNQRWLVWFGAVAGLLCFVWEHFEVLTWLLVHCLPLEPYEASVFMSTLPLVTIFIFGFVGLLLPGMMLKKQAA